MPGEGLSSLVAEWIDFKLFGIIVPTIKLKVYTFWGLRTQQQSLVAGMISQRSALEGYGILALGALIAAVGLRFSQIQTAVRAGKG